MTASKRVIKFRAWSVAEQIMCYSLGSINLQMVEQGIISHDGENYTEAIYMQFTGLHDVNGTEIYEGDIIKHRKYIGGNFITNSINTYEVVWLRYGFSLKPIKDRQCTQYTIAIDENEEYEVIGNIYSHPHLLEAQ